jgi:hypothetical protein
MWVQEKQAISPNANKSYVVAHYLDTDHEDLEGVKSTYGE